jgi:hypothetical protein
MELCHRAVEDYWWCDGKDCKHCRTGVNDLLMYRRCKHPDIMKQSGDKHIKKIGYLVQKLKMCPVLTDVTIR